METIEKLMAQLRNLKAVLRYNVQAGNWERVEALEPQIEEIEAKLREMKF